MKSGRVLWFNETKGFGFIVTEDGKSVFVHYSAILGEGFRTLRPGQTVQFDLYEGEPSGSSSPQFQAKNVTSN